jgi:murein L,D-transpeptidase YafK
LRPRHFASFFSTAFVLVATAANLGGCSISLDDIDAKMKTGAVHPATLALMDKLDMDRAAPILIRIYKEEHALEVWKRDRTGSFALLDSYPICKFSGKLGPKLSEGDRQAPEGFYEITRSQLNPLSREYLAFNIGFPNAFDRSLRRTGSVLMVHGGCRSIGCYAMTDYEMEEIYGLLDEAFKGGEGEVQLQAFPFRMTEQNLTRHADDRNTPFWKMLKVGSDAFLAEGRPPIISVCDRHYVFNPAGASKNLDASAPCPPGVGEDAVAGDEHQSPPAIASGRDRSAYRDDDPARERAAKMRERLLLSDRVALRHLLALCRFKRVSRDQCAANSHLQARAFDHHERGSPRANLGHRTSAIGHS